ncbi:hypothetical protein CCACVL1_19463, partial [Corchorus capsularis]
MSISYMVEETRVYVNQLQRRIEELRRRRLLDQEANRATSETITSPILNIVELDSSMKVHLITRSNVTFTLSDIVNILEEEGAQVLNLSYNNTGDINILSIHCQ